MCVILDALSSIRFWRLVYPLDRMPTGPEDETPWAPAYKKAEVLAAVSQLPYASELQHDGKFHVLVNSRDLLRTSSAHVTHACSVNLPYGAFYRIRDDVFVQSPELVFLRAANTLELPALIAFGDELCGLYSFSKNEERGFRKRERPITDKARLFAFLDLAEWSRGRRKAQKAFRYIVEKSASPMETMDEMLLSLPLQYGGYGLPQPNMNREVSLSAKAARIAKRGTCRLDMSWGDIPFDLEHHGKLDHSSEADKDSDRARVNALKEMGFEVIELTHEQVIDPMAFEYLAVLIAGAIGVHLRKDHLGITRERLALRRALRTWNASSGLLA